MTPDPTAVADAGAAVFASINARTPGFHGRIDRDVILAATGLPFARTNWAGAARFTPETAEARIRDVVRWFDDLGVPFVWRLGPGSQPADLEQRLVANGFSLDPDDMPGMAASLDSLPPLELPDGVTLELVRDPDAFREWLDVMGEGFGMPAEIGNAFMAFAMHGFGDELPTRSFLARVDGRPVATALGVLTHDGVSIANVATVLDMRGRGIGRAVTLATMHAGREAGGRIAVLESSEMGLGVYERLGFTAFGRYKVLARLA